MMLIENQRSEIEEKFLGLCEKIIEEKGFLLYDLEYNARQKMLRLFIMRPDTETALLDDCVVIDQALTPSLDQLEWIPLELILEVSSPGIFRSLRTRQHFLRALNQRISLLLRCNPVPEEGCVLPKKYVGQKKLKGQLQAVDEQGVVFTVGPDDQCRIRVPFTDIKKAHIDPELDLNS